ncbi:MAG TPA: cytochrome P460 family protein, partial [Thermoanaerobaculia bacterium]|nr:cytochrome P460 family protein [Thermoanaerobaculia bacterium]
MRAWTTAAALAAAACIAAAAVAAESGQVPYPTGYRHWFVDHSTVMLPRHSRESEVGIAQVYANPSALKGLKSGKYADGAVFVIDRYEIVEGDDKILSQGKRKALVVMQRDHRRTETGGWAFEGFV